MPDQATEVSQSAPPPEPAAPAAPPKRGRDWLIEARPRLSVIPWAPLADRPAPVEQAKALGQALGIPDLWILRDDLGSDTFSGSKLRKLEYLFGEALARGAREIVTFGAVGSNHAVATAAFGKKLGLRVKLELAGQPRSPLVRDQLLRCLQFGATVEAVDGVTEAYARHQRAPAKPERYVIAPGGSSASGNIGFVSAAFEIAGRALVGELPMPDCVVSAIGTMGSIAGLSVGFASLGAAPALIGVRCSSPASSSVEGIRKSTLELASHLAAIDPHFNDKSLPVRFEERFFGPGYAQGTKEGDTWTKRARDLAGVELEATYTAKVVVALASLSPELRAKRVLLWASQPVYRAPADNDCRALPPALRAYCA